MKKTFILASTALLVATSAFAWSKKTEGQANLGRTYVSFEGAAVFNSYKVKQTGIKETPTQGAGGIAFNVPVFKPGVNALEDVSWFGMDIKAGFNIGGGSVDFGNDKISLLSYDVGIGLVPYLNIETGWSFIQAIKPFAYGKVYYQWNDYSGDAKDLGIDDKNYFGYAAGAGVELVLTSSLSVTGAWNWYANQESGIPNSTSVSLEATYWVNGMFAMAFFGEYNFRSTYDFGGLDTEIKGTTVGVRLKVGFNR